MSGGAARADAAFEALLEFLKRSRGVDFTGYKRASLERRFRRRTQAIGCTSFGDYLDHLQVHPDEYAALFDALLINVTDFFRDPAAWEHLRSEALPQILDRRRADEPLRVWSAGCATGQEAYTVAMILCESLGDQDYRRRVKIYATDIDEEALNVARQATYTDREVAQVPEELRARYFEQVNGRFAFRADLRRAVIFGHNNLVQDAPISRLDLLVCRNTLMYLNAETQGHVLRHFHFALRETGVLMLGQSEMLLSHRDLFEALELKRRIFRKLPQPTSMRGRVAGMVKTDAAPVAQDDRPAVEAALELSPQPQLVVSRERSLVFANSAARTLFQIGPDDVGRRLGDLRIARDPIDLAGAVERGLTDQARIALGEVGFTPVGGGERRLRVTLSPLPSGGVAVAFEDVSRVRRLERELETSRNDLDAAYEELQSTIEELETTNEELQSANEELQTTNEELQSTNEELETMNEELHSTNAELQAINDELRERTGELNSVNEFLEAILTSLGVAVAVVDRSQRVQVWNRGAEDLWGLRRDQASDQHFLALDIGLGPERLAPALRAVISGASPKETAQLDAVNRRGRPVALETTVMPLLARGSEGPEVRGAIVLMEDQRAAGDGET